jgi:hypothetical protein
MKRIGQVIAVAGAAILGTTGIAAAEGLNFHVGPGGASVGIGPQHHHHRHWHDGRGSYAYVPDCHWTTTRHWSRHRHAWVVRRERVCH